MKPRSIVLYRAAQEAATRREPVKVLRVQVDYTKNPIDLVEGFHEINGVSHHTTEKDLSVQNSVLHATVPHDFPDPAGPPPPRARTVHRYPRNERQNDVTITKGDGWILKEWTGVGDFEIAYFFEFDSVQSFLEKLEHAKNGILVRARAHDLLMKDETVDVFVRQKQARVEFFNIRTRVQHPDDQSIEGRRLRFSRSAHQNEWR